MSFTPHRSQLRVIQFQAHDRIKKFASGELQVFETRVAEERMDISAANSVIRFDAVQTPVSLVQSRGRARQANSAFLLWKIQ